MNIKKIIINKKLNKSTSSTQRAPAGPTVRTGRSSKKTKFNKQTRSSKKSTGQPLRTCKQASKKQMSGKGETRMSSNKFRTTTEDFSASDLACLNGKERRRWLMRHAPKHARSRRNLAMLDFINPMRSATCVNFLHTSSTNVSTKDALPNGTPKTTVPSSSEQRGISSKASSESDAPGLTCTWKCSIQGHAVGGPTPL